MARRKRVDDVNTGPPLYREPVRDPLPEPIRIPDPPKVMGDFEFAVYDIVRRLCEEDQELHEAHQMDVAARALLEGLVSDGSAGLSEEPKVMNVLPRIRGALDWLEKRGVLKRKAGPLGVLRNTFLPAKDLLTVMAMRL